MTDNKRFLNQVFENIKLLKPESKHYSLRPTEKTGIDPASKTGTQPVSKTGVTLLITNEELNEEEMEQADKILLACKLDLSTRIVLTGRAFKDGPFLVSKANYLFLFGTGPSELGFNFELPMNRMVSLNGSNWIKTLPVKTLIKNQEAKTDLWKNGLQPHFQKK